MPRIDHRFKSPWDRWTAWVMSRVCVTAGEWSAVGQGASVHLSPPLTHSITGNKKWKSVSYAVMNGAASSSVSFAFVVCLFSLFHDQSKRPEDWEESIFVRHKECGYRLRDNVHFHMYISTSPCGDGRLNSPYEITTDCKTAGLCVSVVRLRLTVLKKGQRQLLLTHAMYFYLMQSLSFSHHLILSVCGFMQRYLADILKATALLPPPQTQSRGWHPFHVTFRLWPLSATLCWLDDILLLTRRK